MKEQDQESPQNTVFDPNNGEIIIYPPWLTFTRKWSDLPRLFLSPETWGSEFDLKYLKDIGYTVEKNDHKFFDGPHAGGLIQVFREGRRWLPGVLFSGETSFYSPKGFHSGDPYTILSIVPRMFEQHRILKDRPVPYAPSLHFSVEELPHGTKECFVALGVCKSKQFIDEEFQAGFPVLGLKPVRLPNCPEVAREAFAKVDDTRLTWIWYSVEHPDLTPTLWIAGLVYLGFRLADVTKNNVRDMHMFSSEYIPGAEFPSAIKWTSRKTKGIVRTCDDW